MTKLKLIIGACVVLGLAACGTMFQQAGDNWGVKGNDFRRTVEAVAGQSAIDCGFLQFDASEARREQAISCTRRATASNVPFKVGYQIFDDDSGGSEAAVRTSSGELLSISFHFELVTSHGAQSQTSVSRCKTFFFSPNGINSGGSFEWNGCTNVPNLQQVSR